MVLLLVGCETPADPEYVANIEDWRKERIASLMADDGYLVLAGLYWLEQGESSIGSSNDNDIVFPRGPERVGVVYVAEDTVSVVLEDGQQRKLLYPTDEEKPTVMRNDSLEWYVIKRGDELGIRLRDQASEVRSSFQGVEHFPVHQDWELDATFTAYEPPKSIPILNIVGYTIDTPSEGFLSFEIQGQQHTLDVLPGGDDTYFVIFGDPTNRESTYGAGRYMYIPKAGAEGKTIVDFNKAYSPPCAFTEYATCPLPPQQNVLDVAIPAGEKWTTSDY